MVSATMSRLLAALFTPSGPLALRLLLGTVLLGTGLLGSAACGDDAASSGGGGSSSGGNGSGGDAASTSTVIDLTGGGGTVNTGCADCSPDEVCVDSTHCDDQCPD